MWFGAFPGAFGLWSVLKILPRDYPGGRVKNPPASAGDIRKESLLPGLGRSPGEGNGNPLQYSCLGNSMAEVLSRSGGEKGLRGSGAGTLGVPLGGTRRVGGLLVLSSRDAGLLEPPERPQGSPASSSVWREDPGLLSRPQPLDKRVSAS